MQEVALPGFISWQQSQQTLVSRNQIYKHLTSLLSEGKLLHLNGTTGWEQRGEEGNVSCIYIKVRRGNE